jgi:predicted O-methyltransferase YrrM
MEIPQVSVKDLHSRLGFSTPINYPESSLHKPLTAWQMEVDDAPIFRYIYKNFRPSRHLEFGTWQGAGTLYCLQECDATVWTINLLHGELNPDGTWAYGQNIKTSKLLPSWVNKIKGGKGADGYQTDALGFIGRHYLEAGLGYRVCQIYTDSLKWDTSNYPPGFFDTALIDGGHTEEIVASDTNKALQLVRSGGLIMWHDFCPPEEVQKQCASPRGVKAAIENNWNRINGEMKDIFWIYPSWILAGIKK